MSLGVLRTFFLLLKSLVERLAAITALLVRAVFTGHLIATLKLLGRTVQDFNDNNLVDFVRVAPQIGSLQSEPLRQLKKRVEGLHSLLPRNERFTYSILVPVYKPKPRFFEAALRSALDQSAPQFEVLVGYDGPQPEAVYEVVRKLRSENPVFEKRLKEHRLDRGSTGGGISRSTNQLAQKASGRYLLLMDHDDWIRPDLLYRYEQTLRMLSPSEDVVLYCDEYKINERDEVIASSFVRKPERPVFPYVFINFICHCLLVPKGLWDQVGGLRPECDGAQDYDLSLRLDCVGARFFNVPLMLYAWRSHSGSTAKSTRQKDYATPAGLRAMRDYITAKKLDWELTEGYFRTSYRAIPRMKSKPIVHAIIPFKDAKDLTLRAVKSLQEQKDVDVLITAVDNQSSDRSIAAELTASGVEVLESKEPFNYSRINNFAAKSSRHSAKTPLILFMNNDVEIAPDALSEMCRWIDQPHVGMVGARLHFPDGLLQHGGVALSYDGNARSLNWRHIDSMRPFRDLAFSRVIRICEAVTAACLLIDRRTFEKVGGFDEVLYPIAYSDTDLARKIRRMGLYPLYTPYAYGTHHESYSRKSGQIEDFEASYWLFANVDGEQSPRKSFSVHSLLDRGLS